MRSSFKPSPLSKFSKKKKNYRRSFSVLILLLLSVVFLQDKLTQSKFRKGLTALFNINSKAIPPTALNKKQQLKVKFKKKNLFWCNTRVVKLNVGDSVFVNKNFKWYLNNTAIDSLFMERWLAKYCKLKILLKTANKDKLKERKPLFCVTFTNDRSQCFYKTSEFTFSWKNKNFLSSQLKEGFGKILFLTNKR